jgi:hypothetical protein
MQLQAIAQAADCGDTHVTAFKLSAQAVHVNLNGIMTDLFAPFTQMLDNLLLADQTTRALEKNFQQTQFAG